MWLFADTMPLLGYSTAKIQTKGIPDKDITGKKYAVFGKLLH